MAHDESALKIFFLDVGQGDCTFIVPPTGQGDPILFDCADYYTAERFVRDHQITRLQAVVASHLDYDHVKGMLPFLKQHFENGGEVGQVVMFPDRVPRQGRNQALRDLIAAALDWEKAPPHPGFSLVPNFRTGQGPVQLAADPQGAWSVDLVLPWMGDIMGELVDGGNDPNHCSAVLRVRRHDKFILIGGDAPLGSWERIEAPLRSAQIIRVPHHGGEIREHGEIWTQFSDLYNAVVADLSVVSVGTNNGYDHPDPDHAAAAHRGHACRLLCTQITPRCHDNPLDLRDEALLHVALVEYPYRHRNPPGERGYRPQYEVPCAGSVVVWITERGELMIEPAPGGAHEKMLLHVDHPLCQP